MADKYSFSEWLQAEMTQRDLSQSELARLAGVTRSAINGVLSGSRGPGHDLCSGIARAFKLPPEAVYRAAGLLPPVAERRAKLEELALVAGDLDDDEIEDLIDIAKMRAKKRKDKQGNIAKTSRSKRPARNALISK